MGANESKSDKQYDFILLSTAEFAKLDQKLLGALCHVNLCKISSDQADTIIMIPKYWSMRSRAVFLNRLPKPNGKKPWDLDIPDNDSVPEPDLNTLKELDRLPFTGFTK